MREVCGRILDQFASLRACCWSGLRRFLVSTGVRNITIQTMAYPAPALTFWVPFHLVCSHRLTAAGLRWAFLRKQTRYRQLLTVWNTARECSRGFGSGLPLPHLGRALTRFPPLLPSYGGVLLSTCSLEEKEGWDYNVGKCPFSYPSTILTASPPPPAPAHIPINTGARAYDARCRREAAAVCLSSIRTCARAVPMRLDSRACSKQAGPSVAISTWQRGFPPALCEFWRGLPARVFVYLP